jgi:hypothetical protein
MQYAQYLQTFLDFKFSPCSECSSGGFTVICGSKCQHFGTLCPFRLHTYPHMKMEEKECSKMAFKLQKLVNHPEGSIQHLGTYLQISLLTANQ